MKKHCILKSLNFILIVLFIFTIKMNLSAQLSPIFDGGQIGYIDSTGKIIIPCKYVADIDYTQYIVNGKPLIDFVLPNWSYFDNKSVTLKIQQKWLFLKNGYKFALVNDKGEYIFAPDDNFIQGFSEGLVVYKKLFKTFEYAYDFEYGYADTTGHIVVQPKYRYASKFSDGAALVLDSMKYMFIKKDGTPLFDFDFIDATPFIDGIAAIKLQNDSLYTFVDKSGKPIFSKKFKYAYNFVGNRARVYDGRDYSFINKKGEYIKIPYFNKAEDFSEGLAVVNQNMKYGFIDTNGNEVIPISLQYASSFSEGLAAVCINGKFGFMDKKGKLVISNDYDYAKSFKYGLAQVWKNNEIFYINKKGKKVYTIFSKSKYKQIASKKIFNQQK